ncbi:MAG: glutathione S-transferase N-terminal domain-containing protein [Myxococcota bacterium]|nr:glutathione S-transferase N-terminal domain-containing protein [Myxococcota bacterium]
MIDVYAGATPNGRIPLLALEVTGLPYELHRVALFEAAHYQPEFLAMNPAAQIPVIVDRDPSLGEPVTLGQTTAILLYLAEKSGQLLPAEPHHRARALEALSLHASDLAPSFYLAYHLERLLETDDEAIRKKLQLRGWKYYVVLDGWLREEPYLGGREVSVADLAAYPWLLMMDPKAVDAMSGLAAWRDRMGGHPGVAEAMAIDLGPGPSRPSG